MEDRFEGMTKVELLAMAERVGVRLPKRTPNSQIMTAIGTQETLSERFLGRRQEKVRTTNGSLKLKQVRDGRRFKYLILEGRKVLTEAKTYHKAKATTRAIALAKNKAFDIDKDYTRCEEDAA